MVSPRTVFFAASVLLGFGGIAAAHHSAAAYDYATIKTVGGTVKTVNWTNPHITFVVETDAKDAEPATTWVFEVSSPGVLTRSGWTKRSLQPGDHAVFQYLPARDGSPRGYLQKVTLPSGQALSFTIVPPEPGQSPGVQKR